MSKEKKQGRGMFIFLCITAFIISFVGSVVFKIAYIPRKLRKYLSLIHISEPTRH